MKLTTGLSRLMQSVILCAFVFTACQKAIKEKGTDVLHVNTPGELARNSGLIEEDPSVLAKIPVLVSANTDIAALTSLNARKAKDSDSDGIPDIKDACPTKAETMNGYLDADGCPDTAPTPVPVVTDTDGDGITDSLDSCPTQAETMNGYQDSDGCPDTPPIVLPPITLPASVLLTMPPVGVQGGEFSCVAWSVAQARSAEKYYTTNATSYNTAINIFSPEYIYNQAKFGNDCSSGTGISTCLNILKNQGVCTWQSMPYTSESCSLLPNSSQVTEAANYKIGAFAIVYQNDLVALKTLLAQHHPLIVGSSIDDNFRYASAGFIWKSFNSAYGTNHSYVLCGYDDSKHAFRAVNSWGTSWGDAGYIWIDYDFFAQLPGSVYVIQNAL